MGKFKNFLQNIGFDEERYDDNDEIYEEDIENGAEEEMEEAPQRPQRTESTPQNYRRAGNIETIKPATYSDAHMIIDKLRDGNIIVFSLELVDDELALRILDFVYGGTFALSGKIKEVGTRVYVVTSHGVNLTEIAGTADNQQKAPTYRG